MIGGGESWFASVYRKRGMMLSCSAPQLGTSKPETPVLLLYKQLLLCSLIFNTFLARNLPLVPDFSVVWTWRGLLRNSSPAALDFHSISEFSNKELSLCLSCCNNSKHQPWNQQPPVQFWPVIQSELCIMLSFDISSCCARPVASAEESWDKPSVSIEQVSSFLWRSMAPCQESTSKKTQTTQNKQNQTPNPFKMGWDLSKDGRCSMLGLGYAVGYRQQKGWSSTLASYEVLLKALNVFQSPWIPLVLIFVVLTLSHLLLTRAALLWRLQVLESCKTVAKVETTGTPGKTSMCLGNEGLGSVCTHGIDFWTHGQHESCLFLSWSCLSCTIWGFPGWLQ